MSEQTALYAMYLRKSRADLELEALGEGETLAKHRKMLDALASRHDIHPSQIVEYREVVSGDSISERPKMQMLLADVHQRKYKGVLVVEVERLARGNTKDQGEVAEAFQASHTKIVTPMKVYDPDNEFDQEYFEFGLFMSRREYKTIRRRLESGKHQSVADGNYILPQRVFGYYIVRPSKKDRTLVIRPDEAKIVQMIFAWYTEEKRSIGWIAKQLTYMGVPTVKGRPEWNRGTIRDMLVNPIYIGKVWWNRANTVKEYDTDAEKLVKVRRYNDTYEIFQGKHDGIIQEDQFEKACQLAKSQKNPAVKHDKEIINPFAGIMECCVCGRNIIATPYPDGRQHRLAHARDTICKKKSLPMADVIDAFVEALKAMIADFELKIENGSNDAELKQYQIQIETSEAELAKLERKRKRLFQDYEDETYTRDEFLERKQLYNAQIEKLKKQIQDAKESAPEPVDYSEQIVSLHAMIDCIKDPDTSAVAKNKFLKRFIEKITYDSIDYGRKKGGKAVLEVILK